MSEKNTPKCSSACPKTNVSHMDLTPEEALEEVNRLLKILAEHLNADPSEMGS